MNHEIDCSIELPDTGVDLEKLRQVLVDALTIEGVASSVLSVTIVDDSTIHRLNLDHLQHDYPTDVISFCLDWTHPDRATPGETLTDRARGAHIEGEIVASLEFAQSQAHRYGWDVQSELTLYIIHGMLHLCGYDDQDSVERSVMHAREAAVLRQCGLDPAADHEEIRRNSAGDDSAEQLPAADHHGRSGDVSE